VTHHLEFLDGKVAGQIAKLLRLAFLADERGEIDGAIAAAHRLLATQGRDIHWLSEQLGERLTAPVQTEPRPGLNVGSALWQCFHRRHLLTPKDRQFVEGIAQQRSPLSVRQQKWLRDIVAKLGNGVAA
jgi:hypothetical protein